MAKRGDQPKIVASNRGVRIIAEEFFKIAWLSRVDPSPEIVSKALNSTRYMLRNNIAFEYGQDLKGKLSDLIQKCMHNLGTRVGHEDDIEKIAWRIATKMKKPDHENAVKEFVNSIDAQIEKQYEFIVPNHVLEFKNGIKELEIGPVKAIETSELFKQENKDHNFTMLVISSKSSIYKRNRKDPNEFLATLPKFSWHVNVIASRSNVEEEALWLINIAISLLRLSYPEPQGNPYFPHTNQIEANPIDKSKISELRLIKENKSKTMWLGGGELPKRYTINEKVINHLSSIQFSKSANEIFSHKQGTVAERVAHGIGWITRGRHSKDRSERFLFYSNRSPFII